MKTPAKILALAVLLPWPCRAGEAEAFAPQSHALDRYRHIWEKSPFVAETPVAKQSAGLEQRFVLTGVASLSDKPMIFVLDRTSLTRMVVSAERNAQGVQLVSVESNHDPKQAAATIRLGAEQATIRYDVAALQNINAAPENPKAARAGAAPKTPPPVTAANSSTTADPALANGASGPPVPVKRVVRKSLINIVN